MRVLRAFCLVSLLLSAAAHAEAAGDKNPSFNLINRGSAPIKELYFTPAGDANWGRNRLDGGSIAGGATFPARRRVDGNCIFDIRVVFAGGRTEDRRDINTCEVADVTFGQAGGTAAGERTTKAPDDPSFRLVNRGHEPIVEAFATPAGLGNWGQNRLAGDAVPPAANRLINVEKQGSCLFDLRVVFANHKALERRRANLCRMTDLPVP